MSEETHPAMPGMAPLSASACRAERVMPLSGGELKPAILYS